VPISELLVWRQQINDPSASWVSGGLASVCGFDWISRLVRAWIRPSSGQVGGRKLSRPNGMERSTLKRWRATLELDLAPPH